MANEREIIAKRIARELHDGDIVNLGIGLPTLVADYLPEGVEILLQSENGMIGMGPAPEKGTENPDICNAGGAASTILPGGAFFDSSLSFAIIRGGHVDVTVLGALEVDEQGSLASHIVPGKMIPGMGGAMDLIVGSKKVIIATTHTNKGKPKILKKCALPLTAVSRVNLIVTELCVLEVTKDGLMLREIAPDTSVEHVQSLTEAALIVPTDVKTMAI